MVVSVVPPNPIIIIILSPSREVRRERRAPIIKSTIHKFLSALSSPHGSRRLLPVSDGDENNAMEVTCLSPSPSLEG